MVAAIDADHAETIRHVTTVIEPGPPLAPEQQPIDLTQLSRMTLGEQGLEREVLSLFDLQAGILLSRMLGEPPKAIAGLAHTLTGSARGVGAWRVAKAAEAVERLAGSGAPDPLGRAVSTLSGAVAEAQAHIASILGTRYKS